MISLKYFMENLHRWDWCHYRNSHIDLKRFDAEALLLHAINHGLHENRRFVFTTNNNNFPNEIIDKNFKILKKKGYIKINDVGFNNKVRYFIDNLNKWNWKKYRDDNSDLNNMGCKKILKHAISYGLNENRRFVYEDYNIFPQNIINNNIELLEKYGYKKEEIKKEETQQNLLPNNDLEKITMNDNIIIPNSFNYPLLDNVLNKKLDSDTINYNNHIIHKINNSDNIDIDWNFWGKNQLNIKKEEIIKFKNDNLLHEIPKEINELFIPHYKPNIERKKYIEEKNETLKYNINYITKYDGNELYKNRKIFENKLDTKTVSFSIITATYGHSNFIKRTLDSINSQKYINWENIIYDANNDNKTQEILAHYISNNHIQNKIHYVKEKDRGQVHAINKGFIECNGSILHFLNSDDIFFDENVLERVAKEFEDDDTLDILYGAGNFIDENNNIVADLVKWRPYSLNTDPYTFIEHFKSHVSILQPSVFFRKRVIEKIGLLDDNDQYAFDHDFWIRTLKSNCKWKFIDCNLSKALLQSNAKSVSGKMDQLYNSLKTSFKHFDNVSDAWIDRYIKILNDDFFEKLENKKTYNPSKLEIEAKKTEILEEFNNDKLKIQLSNMNLYDYNRFSINNKLSLSEYSLYCKLLYTLSQNKSFYHWSEDDIIFTDYHTTNFQEAFKIFTKENYDIMFLGAGSESMYPKNLENNKFVYKMNHQRAGTLEFLITNKCVSKIYVDLLQIDAPIDLKLETLIHKYNLDVSWYIPEITLQGSKINVYKGNLNNGEVSNFLDENFKIKEYPINIMNYFHNHINEPFNKYHQSEFTIVITNFQRLKYLKINVDQLLKNGFYNFIISCYSPSNEHFDFFKKIQQISPLIRINVYENDYGVNKLWINGLQMVKTKYVLILHDDDYLNDNFFENFIDINEKLKEFSYILWNGRACNDNNEEVWKGNILECYQRHEDTKTGIKSSQTVINNYMNEDGFVMSPVVQIFETKKSIHILQWCELNFKYPENFSRPKMMLGNEIALTYYNLKDSDKFYFYDEYYTTYIQSETSETFNYGEKLLKGYNNARALLKNSNVDLLLNNDLLKVFVINTKDKYDDNKDSLDIIKNSSNIFLEEIPLKYDNNIIGDYINDNFQHTLIINSYNLGAIHKIVTREIKDSCIKFTNKDDNIKIDNINDIKQIDINTFNNIDFIYLHN